MLKKTYRLIAMILVAVTVLGMGSTALADNVCTLTSGNANSSRKFTVVTSKRWLLSDKITFSQTKGTANWKAWSDGGGSPNHSMYAAYNITYSKVVNGKETNKKTVTLSGAKKSIKLDKNSTYKFTVTPVSLDYYTVAHPRWGAMNRWVTVPSWSIKTTKGIASCDG